MEMGIRAKQDQRRQKRRMRQHKGSMLVISVVIILMMIVVFAKSSTLKATEKEFIAQEQELTIEIEKEKERASEIDELEQYVETDAYIEDVARDKLGMAYQNELILRER